MAMSPIAGHARCQSRDSEILIPPCVPQNNGRAYAAFNSALLLFHCSADTDVNIRRLLGSLRSSFVRMLCSPQQVMKDVKEEDKCMCPR